MLLRHAATVTLLGVAVGSAGVVAASAVAPASSAFADTQAYALYCPGTPVGNIGFTNVVTTGTITPASPSTGSQFNLTNFQTKVDLATAIVNATAALGNSAVTGTAGATVNATGATPASLSSGTLSFNVPIPSPVPSTGLALALPATATTVGPFTATGGAISLTQNDKASLNVSVTPGSAPLALTCTSYANNAVTAGLGAASPSASPLSPVIATATASGSSTPTTATPTTTPTSATPTTAAPVTSPTSATTPPSTVFTGAGPGLWILALFGLALVGLSLASFLVGANRRGPLLQALRTAGPYPRRLTAWKMKSSSDPAAVPPGLWIDVGAPGPSDDLGDSSTGLWAEGSEPDSRT